MTTICQKSEVTVDQAQVMTEAIEEAVVETKTKSDESEEEGVTENTLLVTETEADVPKEDPVERRKRPNQSGAPRETTTTTGRIVGTTI